MARIIAICGRKRHGKDTVANYISSKYGYENVKFASVLKSICKQVFNLSDPQIEDDEKDVIDARYDKTPRQIMQFIGTDMMQFELQKFMPRIGRLVWTTALLDSTKDKCIVISDLRFKHEADEVFRCDPNALIIRVNRNCVDIPIDSHVSENELDGIPCNLTLNNDGSIIDLHASIDKCMESIKLDGH